MSFRTRVWDLPTRLFHWLLALTVIGLLVTGQIGGQAMAWHFRLGYVAMSLLVFRLLWGAFGGYWSRFSTFMYSPTSLVRYLKGRAPLEHTVGHSPVGAASVFCLLLFLCLQVATGLLSDDEIAWAGPLTRFVSSAWVSAATAYHKDIGQVILIALISLHLAAIFFYLFRKGVNLIRPMMTGDKLLDQPVPASRDGWLSRLFALLIFIVAAIPAIFISIRFS